MQIIFFRKNKIILTNIIFIFLFTLNVLNGNEIILKKGEIIVTKNDLDNYIEIYKSYYNSDITEGTAIKNTFLMFKTIDHQIKNNSNFEKVTTNMMKEDIIKFENIFNKYILEYFLRFEILKNDYIKNYILKLDIDKLDANIKEEILFYKTQNCKILKLTKNYHQLSNLEKKSLFSKGNSRIMQIDKENYICLNENNIKEINNIITNTLSQNGYKSFLNYAYKKIK